MSFYGKRKVLKLQREKRSEFSDLCVTCLQLERGLSGEDSKMLLKKVEEMSMFLPRMMFAVN